MNELSSDTYRQVDLLNESALKLSEAGEAQMALDLLQKAIEIHPDHAPTHVVMGIIKQNLDKSEEAEEALRKAFDLDPDYDEALIGLGLLLISKDQKSEGTEWLCKYFEMNNWKDYKNLEVLASTLVDLGREEELTKVLSTAWSSTVMNPVVDNKIGFLYSQHLKDIGMDELSINVLERIAVQTQDHEVFNQYAESLLVQKKYREAIRAWEYAMDLVHDDIPEYPEYDEEFDLDSAYESAGLYLYQIASCYVNLEDGEKALRAVEASSEYFGEHNLDYLYPKGNALMLLNRYDEAVDVFQKCIDSCGDPPEDYVAIFYMNKARAYENLGDLESSVSVYKEAITHFPQNKSLYYQVILNNFEIENYVGVMSIVDQAIRSDLSKINLDAIISVFLSNFFFMGFQKDALKIVEPFIMGNPDNFAIPILSDLDQFISNEDSGERDRAIHLFEYISTLIPHYIGIQKRKSWHLIDQEQYSPAEKVIIDALNSDLGSSDRLELLNNLGYIYILQSKWDEAEKVFLEVASHEEVSEYKPDFNWLEIVFLKDGKIITDYCRPPKKRGITPKLAAKANLSSLALSQNNPERATSFAIQVLTGAPDSSLGYELLGFISLARGDQETAKEAWGHILKSVKESDEDTELPVIQPIKAMLREIE